MTRRAKIVAALALLGAVHGAVAMAGFLAPYDFADQHRDYPYAPPTRVHFVDDAGRFHWRPFVCGDGMSLASGGQAQACSTIYPLRFGVHGRLFGVDAPGAIFLLGSDAYGRDVFSRVLYGGRISLLTGLAAALASLALGLAVGLAAGFHGGWPDRLLMRGGELFMALPWLYLLLGVRAALPLHVSPAQGLLALIAIIGCAGWVRPARLIRGVALSARERGFVLAARGFGARDFYLIRRHVLPMTMGVTLTQATVLIPQYVLAELTLSFLGLGVSEPIPSWGNMLAEARQYHVIVSHAWMLSPGIAVVPVLLGFVLLADQFIDNRTNGI
jgi:peptide/nickel transport system permease protein